MGYRGAIVPVLPGGQDIYGYLPKEVMQQIAEDLRILFSKIYGVATFYAQFHLKPRGRNIFMFVRVHPATCGAVSLMPFVKIS
jgi:NADH-quinone oxidoreductase subunit E